MCLKYFIKSCEVHYNQNVLIYVKQHLLLKKLLLVHISISNILGPYQVDLYWDPRKPIVSFWILNK